MTAFRLDGEIALVTGGGTGLGLATAKRMAEAGARVVIVGRREEPLKAAAGKELQYLVHDVTELDQADALVAKVKGATGGVPTILVNNAGIHLKKWAVETSVEEFQKVLSTHVLGSFALTKAVAPAMMEAGKGSIVFIASMASIFGIPQVIAYTAAKSAYTGMVRGLATELSPRGVRVNAIAPGWIESPMQKTAFAGDPKRAEKILGRTPMGRLGDPDDVAYAAVYLCAPAAKFVTGTMLVVDGGISVGF
jgi:gluconate 5-dehydrogenase